MCSKHGTGRRTCQSCDTDANCFDGEHYCVPMTYKGQAREEGYCLKASANGCSEPYTIETTSRTSLSGATAAKYCGINESVTTCEAVRALVTNQSCSGADTDCPEGGLCRKVGTLSNRCTYQCSLAVHCPADAPANTCDTTTGGVTYCGG
jgi:hypothetical protein